MKIKNLVLALVLLTLVAPAANAKLYDTEKVTVTGPGLAEELVISGRDWFLPRTRQPGTNHVMGGIFGATGRIASPPEELGPGYRVTYHLAGTLEGTKADVTQELYPFADNGPVFHIPMQVIRFGDFELVAEEGWAEAPPRVVAHLRSFGLPDAEAVPGPDRRPMVGVIAIVVLAGALLWRRSVVRKVRLAPPPPLALRPRR